MACQSVLSTTKLFADDSLLYRNVTNERDCALLQHLDRLQEWEKKLQMAFNADKCEVLRITNKKHPFQQNYFIQASHQVWSGVPGSHYKQRPFLEQTCSQHLQEGKLHHGLPETQHQSSLPASKKHSLQDNCQTNSRIRLIRMFSPHQNRHKPTWDGAEKNCEICPKRLQTHQ